MASALGMKSGIVASTVSYGINSVQERLIAAMGVICCDMEAAPEASILLQTGTNFIVIKVISNGIFPGNPSRMEQEYKENKAQGKSILCLTVFSVKDRCRHPGQADPVLSWKDLRRFVNHSTSLVIPTSDDLE